MVKRLLYNFVQYCTTLPTFVITEKLQYLSNSKAFAGAHFETWSVPKSSIIGVKTFTSVHMTYSISLESIYRINKKPKGLKQFNTVSTAKSPLKLCYSFETPQTCRYRSL